MNGFSYSGYYCAPAIAPVVKSTDHGSWLEPVSGSANVSGSNTYSFTAALSATVVGVFDSLSGSQTVSGSFSIVTAEILHPSAASSYDYLYMILGSDTLPVYTDTDLTYNDYRNISNIVVAPTRVARAGGSNGTDLRQFMHEYRYYTFVVQSTTQDPDCTITMNLRFKNSGDYVA